MTRRDRIRARMIYDRWACLNQRMWYPGAGWVSFGMDLGKPGSDRSVVTWRRGYETLTIHEIKVPSDTELRDLLDRKGAILQKILDDTILSFIYGPAFPSGSKG